MKLLVVIFCALSIQIGAAQKGFFEFLTFENFIKEKCENSGKFSQTMYQNLKFPGQARHENIQTEVDVLYINYSAEEYEIFLKNDTKSFFEESITSSIKATRGITQNLESPFITKFCISYKITHGDSIKSPCQFELITLPIPPPKR